jgi:hypothetical protein
MDELLEHIKYLLLSGMDRRSLMLHDFDMYIYDSLDINPQIREEFREKVYYNLSKRKGADQEKHLRELSVRAWVSYGVFRYNVTSRKFIDAITNNLTAAQFKQLSDLVYEIFYNGFQNQFEDHKRNG